MIIYKVVKTKRCKRSYHDDGYNIDYYNMAVGSAISSLGFYFKNINRAYKALEKYTKHYSCGCKCEIRETT